MPNILVNNSSKKKKKNSDYANTKTTTTEGSKKRAVQDAMDNYNANRRKAEQIAADRDSMMSLYSMHTAPTDRQYEYAKKKLNTAANNYYNGYDDNLFHPNAKKALESTQKLYTDAKNRKELDDFTKQFESYTKKEQEKNTFRNMTYEDLRKTIDSGYLSSEQSKWAEDVIRTKANSEQATDRANYLNEQAARLEQDLYDRYGGTPAYFGIHEQDMYSRQQKQINNLRQMAEQYAGQAWIAEGLEKGEEAVRSATYEKDYMMVPNRAYNEQYSGIFGLISDDEIQTKEGIAGARARAVMTDEEKLKYSALYNTQGPDAAKRYFDSLTYDLDERLQNRKAESVTAKMDAARNADNLVPNVGIKWLDDYIEKTAKQSLEGSAFVNARLNNLASGIGALDATFQRLTNAGGKPVNWNTESFTPHTVSQAIQESQLSQIQSPYNPQLESLGKFAYQTGGSMIDSLGIVGASLLGIPGATAILGMSAATDSMLKAKERGATDGQAVSVGILAGVAETLFEEVSLEKLLTAGTPATIAEAIKNIFLRQGVTEASEEVATTIANTITDAMIMGDKSELKTNIQRYVDMGYSQSDAERLGGIDWLKDIFMDALGGFVSGAMFGAGQQSFSYANYMSGLQGVSNAATTTEAIERMSDMASTLLDENGQITDSRAAADRLQKTYEETMGRLSENSIEAEEAKYQIDQEIDQAVKTGQMKAADAARAKEFAHYVIESNDQVERTGEMAKNYEERSRSILQEIAEKSTARISSVQSVVDNYNGKSLPTQYFGAWRYYEQAGMQAKSNGEKNTFDATFMNDTRYDGIISREAAQAAYAAGFTIEPSKLVTQQIKQMGEGIFTASQEALEELAKHVEDVDATVGFLTAVAKRSGLDIDLDAALKGEANGAFYAAMMSMAISPDANIVATVFHEGGHAIERYDPKAYAQLKADMLDWYAQSKGMADVDALAKAYEDDSYKGYSRADIETEMVNDAFGSLFNAEDAARDLADWMSENKTEEEQQSFKDKLIELIDRVMNWFKSLVSTKGITPMQKRTAEMQARQAQEFRKEFLSALDTAVSRAKTTGEFFSSDGSGHDYSMKSFVDSLGFGLDDDLNIVDENGDPVKHVTGDMIRDSKMGAMIEYARENNRISQKDMDDELDMLAGILNMAIERGDNNIMMYWEVAGSMVFSALKDNSDKQYGLTVDMTTICAKTKAIVDAMSETMAMLGRGLTREETEVVYYQTGKNGEPTPCPVCYVFSRWFGIGGLLDDISNFQKEYGKQSSKKDLEFAQRILAEVMEYKDSTTAAKQKEYWSSRDNAWKYGRIASDAKSKYNSNIDSAEKAIANSDAIRATIAELQEQQKNVDEKTAKKLQTQINKEMKKKALLTDEERQQKFADIDEFKRKIHDIEAWQWLVKTKLSMDKDGNFTVNKKWRPVPKEILFDLNRGAEFAEQYPATWAYRTGKGSAMGKAMMPYSDVRLGEITQGVAKGGVKEIKMGIDPDDELKFNPFNATDKKSVKKQLEILESAVKKTRRQNLIGGMRFQSTSDFRYEYGSDYLMAFLELQAIGSNVQLYTKVIEAVDFLASMGADINMSAMPLGDGYYVDENGVRHLQSSSVTGINFDAAVEMSRKYDNTQIIMVGINRDHILACIEGDEVTFVIPFHGSGQNVAQIAYLMDMLRENLDVTKAQDYTNFQSDHDMLKDSRELTDEEKARGINSWGLTVEERARAKATRDLRMDILTGKLWTTVTEIEEVPGKNGRTKKNKVKKTVPKQLTAEQSAVMRSSKFLGDLYERFYLDENSREYGVSLEKDVAEQVFPYEYWDKTSTYDNADVNGQRFVEYCAEIGYAPRFSGYDNKAKYNPEFDFYTNGTQKGYWKLLIDRPMYSNKYDANGNWIGYGAYREQQAINVSKFQTQTIDPSWQTATYGNVMGLKNNPEKTQKIASESVAAIKKGLRYDTETKTLVKKGTEKRPSMDEKKSATEVTESDDVVDLSLRVKDYERFKDQIGDAEWGININDSTQPFTEEIFAKVNPKTIETRDDPTLRHLIGQRVGIVRTGKGKAQLVGFATISDEITYDDTVAFDKDRDKHHLAPGNPYYDNWKTGTKYGYVLENVTPLVDENGNRTEIPMEGYGVVKRALAPTEVVDYSKAIEEIEEEDPETAIRQYDKLYMLLATNPDGYQGTEEERIKIMDTINRIVAEKRGFTTPKLYHGTLTFGFTKFEHGGNGIFVAVSKKTAKSYAKSNPVVREIGTTGHYKTSADLLQAFKENTDEKAELVNRDAQKEIAKKSIAKDDETLERLNSEEMSDMFDENGDLQYIGGPALVRDRERVRKQVSSMFDDLWSNFLDVVICKNELMKAIESGSTDGLDYSIEDLEDTILQARNASKPEDLVKWVDKYWYGPNMKRQLLKSVISEMADAMERAGEIIPIVKNTSGEDMISYHYLYDSDDITLLTLEKAKERIDYGAGMYQLYGNPGDKVLVVECNGRHWNELGDLVERSSELQDLYEEEWDKDEDWWADEDYADWVVTDDITERAAMAGYTSVLFKDIHDGGPVADEYVFFDSSQIKSADTITYDDDGNIIPPSERFSENEDVRWSKMRSNGLTAEEQKALENRVKEAERNAAREQKRAEEYKAEMKVTPKFTPDAASIAELANELAHTFSTENVDVPGLEQKLKDMFTLTNEAASSGKEKFATRALDLATEIATDIVDSTLADFVNVSANGKALRSELISMQANAVMDRILQTKMAKSTKADKWNAKVQEAKAKLEATEKELGKTATYAIREAKKVERLEQEFNAYKQKMADKVAYLKAKTDAEIAFNNQYYRERIQKLREQYKAKYNRDMFAQREHYRGKIANIKEQQKAEKSLKRLNKSVNALREMLSPKNAKNLQYVPDLDNGALKAAVSDYLATVDFVTKTMARTGIEMKSDGREVSRLDAIRKIAESARNMQSKQDAYYVDLPDYAVEYIDSLKEWIGSLLSSLETARSEGWLPEQFHARVANSDMLDLFNKLTINITHAIQNINSTYVNARFAHIGDMAQATYNYLKDMNRAKGLSNNLSWSLTTPYYAFQRFGDGGQAVFEGLSDGFDRFGMNADIIKNFQRKTAKNPNGLISESEQIEWGKEVKTINGKDARGKDVTLELTAAQLMSLYCLSRREAALQHLYKGGITLRDQRAGRKTITNESPVHVTYDQVQAAIKQLSSRQLYVAQELQKFMSTVCSEWGNEVTMRRWGVKLLTEQFYFPMATYDGKRNTISATDDQSYNLYALDNSGFMKPLQKNASNALVLDNIFKAFGDHATNMAKYNALVLPMLDTMRWYNWSTDLTATDSEGDEAVTPVGVMTEIRKVFGESAVEYFRKLMSDLNNAQMEGGVNFDPYGRFLGNYKAASVAANLRVVALQPTAIARAAMVISPGYITRGAAMKGGLEEMSKYSGIWKWKDFGMYGTDVGRSLRRQLAGETSKAKATKNNIVEWSLKAAEFADQITWAALWNACKIEQQAQHPGVEYEALMELTRRRFNEVIFSTQVFDSTLSRSDIMRKQDKAYKMGTAFMAEPLLSLNMVQNEFIQYSMDAQKHGKGAAWKKHGNKITRSLAVYTVTNLAAAIAESIMDAYRDDDDEPWLEKFLEHLVGDWSEVNDVQSFLKALYSGNFAQDMSAIGKIPLLKDLVSFMQGYDIGTRMDMQGISNLLNVFAIWNEKINIASGKLDRATRVTWYGNMTLYGAIYKSLQALSQVSGIPVYNLVRDATPIFNWTIGSLTGFKLETYEQKYGRLDKAIENDTADFASAVAELKKKGVKESDINSRVKEKLKEMFPGTTYDMDKYKKLLMEKADMREKDAEALLMKWKMEKDTGVSYDNMKSSFMDGTLTFDNVVDYRVKYGGEDRETAAAKAREWKVEKRLGYSKDDIDDDYIDGRLTREQAIQSYVDYGVSREEAEQKVELIDFVEDNPGAADISYSAMSKYKTYCQKAKVPVAMYYDAWKYYNSTTSDDDTPKRDKVLAYIDKKPITKDQKDALYLGLGYKESTIDDAPWH